MKQQKFCLFTLLFLSLLSPTFSLPQSSQSEGRAINDEIEPQLLPVDANSENIPSTGNEDEPSTDECSCLNEEDCTANGGEVSTSESSVCTEPSICCLLKVDLIDLLTIPEIPEDPSTTVAPEEEPNEPCTCMEKNLCTETLDLSSLVHIRTKDSHTCSETEVCCPNSQFKEPEPSPKDVACTCVPRTFCIAEKTESSQKDGFPCPGATFCCPNFQIRTPESEECYCTNKNFCEDDPSLPLTEDAKNKRCIEPEVCCQKPKLFDGPPKCGLSFESNFRFDQRNPVPGVADFAEYPWMIVIYELGSDGTEEYRCGGSLIHPQVVLTSAYCVHKKSTSVFKIRAGDLDLESTSEVKPYIERLVNKRTIHPQFSASTSSNDVALLYLDKEIPLQQHINTICLPQNDAVKFDLNCTATGWGNVIFRQRGLFQSSLKELDMPYIANKECQALLQKTRLGSDFTLDSSSICAGGATGDTCTGDAGSPLICKMQDDSNRFMEVGIVSWGLGCGTPDVPGVYASTAQASEWIRNTVITDFGEEAASYFT